MNVMLCESSDKHKFNAAKARKDVRKIVNDMGYRDIVLFHNRHPKPLVAIEIIINSIRAVFAVGNGETLFFQYPYYPDVTNRILFFILRMGKKRKKYRVTMLIHDSVALRSQSGDPNRRVSALRKEISAWDWIDNVICHTENMKKEFDKTEVNLRCSILGPFDFLYSGKLCKRTYSTDPVVMIAGNLSVGKCKYVYELSKVKHVRFDLFGTNYTGIEDELIKYRGKFEPQDLILHLDGQFGLVWDGETVETCSGDYGNYLRYNSPHKFSLYLAAGVPLIVWKESALAKYVENNKIGIVIRSLRELKSKLDAIDKTEYSEMVTHVMKAREDIVYGRQLKNAIG